MSEIKSIAEGQLWALSHLKADRQQPAQELTELDRLTRRALEAVLHTFSALLTLTGVPVRVPCSCVTKPRRSSALRDVALFA